jgi:formate hydrogenlyase subunit 3/multisubunit Na+/H+ antiporter MnhD subunit
MTTALVLCGIAALLVTTLLAVPIARRPWATSLVYAATAAISACLIAVAVARLLGGPGAGDSLVLPLGIPWIGAHFAIDALAAFFLGVVNLGGLVASLYAIGYGRHEAEPQRVLPFYPAFLAGMNLVLVAGDAFTFLFAWETMSLASWALVVAHHREPENLRAGYVYIVMASAGTMALLLAFGLLAGPAGGLAFADMRGAAPGTVTAAAVFGLAILGAGSKAGLMPLHAWLPLAHPAAPSHVSALMSGVMTKVAVYAFIRIVFDLAGPGEWWWATVLLVLGAGTAVLGILYALVQDDVKRVLAYSTIENIGLVFVGLGLALAFRANAMPGAAALALTAALLHVLNHASFKSLLFLGAGAMVHATGSRRLDSLGGLIHRMPRTALAMLVGAAAISALPPLNGFVSEWLTFQAVLLSPDLPAWDLRIIVPAVGAMLALSAALAAACFVRFYGVSFLGRPRTAEAAAASEADGWSTGVLLGLAVLCLGLGIVPGFVIDALAPVTTALVGGRMPDQAAIPWLSIVPIAESRSSYNGLLVFLFMAGSAGIAALAIHALASSGLRRAPAWDCGFPDPSPATQYTAASFSQPLRRVFAKVYRTREGVDMPAPGEMRPATLSVETRDLAWDGLYQPTADAVLAVADRLNRFQFLTVRRYLGIVFAALVLLLFLLAVWP